MKKLFFIPGLMILVVLSTLLTCKPDRVAPEKEIAGILIRQVDSFKTICALLQSDGLQNGFTGSRQLEELFLKARLAYKKFEWAAEYFEPTASRLVNGPPVDEVENSGQVLEPAGLQVMENMIFPAFDKARKKELQIQLDIIQKACAKYTTHFSRIDIFDWQVFDAAKLQVYRIMTLGIAGFDDPLTQKSMFESATSLESLKNILSFYTAKDPDDHLPDQFDKAINYLEKNNDFNAFDRMEFIRSFANPITTGISETEERLKIPVTYYPRLLNQDAKTLFDTSAFNINAYAPDPSSFLSKKKIELGKILFADPNLSGNGKRSCKSCHQPDKAFADGLAKNTIIDERGFLPRNTPTLINAALQPSLFYDLRVRSLEEKSRTVVQSMQEMHGSMALSVKHLWQDKTYRELFQAAFPEKDKNSLDTFEVMNAIGSYVRSLVMLNSRFDAYMRGEDNAAMNDREINGFNLFMGKAKCGTCHYMPLFSGNFPPRFVKMESEVIGVPETLAGKSVDADLGRYNIQKTETFRHAFKTPGLRNVGRTAPYMHNGIYQTLEQVMDFYNKGGAKGLGLSIDNQTLPFDSLGLHKTEIENIIFFMRSLDSR
jgi:cytochrome c peroxidase